jgi:hypothetical protein
MLFSINPTILLNELDWFSVRGDVGLAFLQILAKDNT